MEILGQINGRQVLYANIRANQNWHNELPTDNWVVFTIGDDNDIKIAEELEKKCLDKNVNYTCSTGQLAEYIHHAFDTEIVERIIAYENNSGKKYDYEVSPLTTFHTNFSEGFWFATNLAYHPDKEINKVVCLDFTKKGVRGQLIDLINKLNIGWLPSDKEFEQPIYD
jgi:hypothetical protein